MARVGFRFECRIGNQNCGRQRANELSKESGYRRVKVNLSKPIRFFETLFDSAMMHFLFDGDGQEIWRDVLVNFDA